METYKQKLYNFVLAVTQDVSGRPLHTIPLNRITRDELKYLAFVHGPTAIVPNSVKYVGEDVVEIARRTDDGREIVDTVNSQEQEYVRIWKKYDMSAELVGTGKARQRVEECFKTRLDDFDETILIAADPIAVAEQAAVAAELAALEIATRPEAKQAA